MDDRTDERIGGVGERGEKRHGPPLRRAGRYGKPPAGQHKRIRKTGRKSCRTFALPPKCPQDCCRPPSRAAPPPRSTRHRRPTPPPSQSRLCTRPPPPRSPHPPSTITRRNHRWPPDPMRPPSAEKRRV